MPDSFKFREVQIQIQPGVTLVVDVGNSTELKALLQHLRDEGLAPSATNTVSKETATPVDVPSASDDPSAIVEIRSELPSGSLAKKKVLAFKNGVPQLIRTGIFANVTDAVLVLLYAVEVGLRSGSIAYDNFKPLYESQGLKSGTSLPMLLNNLKNAGYIGKKQYDTSRTLTLSPKGSQKAEEVLKGIVSKDK